MAAHAAMNVEQLHRYLLLVLLHLQLLVVRHGLQPVVPVADGMVGAAGQPLRDIVPVAASKQAGRQASARR